MTIRYFSFTQISHRFHNINFTNKLFSIITITGQRHRCNNIVSRRMRRWAQAQSERSCAHSEPRSATARSPGGHFEAILPRRDHWHSHKRRYWEQVRQCLWPQWWGHFRCQYHTRNACSSRWPSQSRNQNYGGWSLTYDLNYDLKCFFSRLAIL